MIWPPLKAWTSNIYIEGQVYFVAINYGGRLYDRWVIMMSVLDSSVVVKISWKELCDPSFWKCGWDEKCYSNPSKIVNKCKIETSEFTYPSCDSGLTIPITKNIIRPWFGNH